MADYTFYTNPMSRGGIVRWALHEVGADYDTRIIDWLDKPDDFLALTPMAKVPVLVHHHGAHDHVVTECAAICHYLAARNPDADLLPREEELADYFRYMFFAAGPLEQAVTNNSMGWSIDDPMKQGMLGYGTFDRTLDSLDAMLSDRAFVCGDRFTMADIYVGSHIIWGLSFKSIPTRPVFEAYAERIRHRPALVEANAIDGKLAAQQSQENAQ